MGLRIEILAVEQAHLGPPLGAVKVGGVRVVVESAGNAPDLEREERSQPPTRQAEGQADAGGHEGQGQRRAHG